MGVGWGRGHGKGDGEKKGGCPPLRRGTRKGEKRGPDVR